MSGAARATYTALLTLLLPLVLLRLAWRGRRNRGYWRRWGERLGRYRLPALEGSLWVHAVSVGEVQAAAPLIKALRARHPDRPVVVTTTTPTGSERVKAAFGDAVFHVYLPYDLPGPVNRFLRRVRPAAAVIMETEVWPNLFAACARWGVSITLANARLSERSAAGYRRIAPLTREALAHVTTIAARGEADAERFRALGAPAERVKVVGNLKYDLEVPRDLADRAEALRRDWGEGRPVWVAASTHEGEDGKVLEAFARVRRDHPDCLLVLVPRHPERFDTVAALCERNGLAVVRRTEDRPVDPGIPVFLGDTLGELALFYAAADLAFIGGSLVPTGGHNMLEAAALGRAVVTGPHLFNFQEVSEHMLTAQALVRVEDADELGEAVARLLADSVERARMGEAGRALVAGNRGALERLVALIEENISCSRRRKA